MCWVCGRVGAEAGRSELANISGKLRVDLWQVKCAVLTNTAAVGG